MPEGDTVARLARRMDAVLAGRTLLAGRLLVPAHAGADLAGATVLGTATHGKHLLTRLDLDGDALTLHTHLRMDGEWALLGPRRRLPAHRHRDVRALLVTTGERSAAGLRLPVVELLRTRDEHDVVGHLGPDLLHDSDHDGDDDSDHDGDHDSDDGDHDSDDGGDGGSDGDGGDGGDDGRGGLRGGLALAAANLAADPARPLAGALLDQRVMAGLGNLWANELCFLLGRSPWTPVGDLGEGGAERVVARAARALRASAAGTTGYQVTTGDTRPGREHWVAGRAGQPCRRCGTTVLVAEQTQQGDGGEASRYGVHRRTWWCPHCQAGPGPG